MENIFFIFLLTGICATINIVVSLTSSFSNSTEHFENSSYIITFTQTNPCLLNPSGVLIHLFIYFSGFHPELLTLNPFGVCHFIKTNQYKSVKSASSVFLFLQVLTSCHRNSSHISLIHRTIKMIHHSFPFYHIRFVSILRIIRFG